MKYTVCNNFYKYKYNNSYCSKIEVTAISFTNSSYIINSLFAANIIYYLLKHSILPGIYKDKVKIKTYE